MGDEMISNASSTKPFEEAVGEIEKGELEK
jgi:hypothetical protein